MPSPEEIRLRNAKIVLEVACLGKRGESVVIVAFRDHRPCVEALARAAIELGMLPMTVDAFAFLKGEDFRKGRVLAPLKAALEAADIVINFGCANYGLLVGDPDISDASLTASRRWVYLQDGGMETWDISPEEVGLIRKRTEWLVELLGRSSVVRVTSPAGTDFTFGMGEGAKALPILGILPLYGEVAVTPRQGSENGVYLVDGPTQKGVRTKDELDRPPLKIAIKNGRVTEISGDPVQVKRCREFIASGEPPADAVDEVGIVTTKLKENDIHYWSDGTHHHDCAHIALGNNLRRDTLVHGPRHMDGELRNPTIYVDGLLVVRDGAFCDEVLTRTK
jgi:leucyl aminopeptidase (aminopeptidase T)